MTQTIASVNISGQYVEMSEERSDGSTVVHSPEAVVVQRLKEARDAQGLTGHDMAGRLGQIGSDIDYNVLANIESGRRKSLQIAEVLELALALDLRLADLITPLPGTAVGVGMAFLEPDDFEGWLKGTLKWNRSQGELEVVGDDDHARSVSAARTELLDAKAKIDRALEVLALSAGTVVSPPSANESA